MAHLIFFKQSGVMADKIRLLDGGPYSHVGLVRFAGLSLLDSTPYGGVGTVPMFHRLRESESATVRVLDMEPVVSPDSLIGIQYDHAWMHGKTALRPYRLHCATLIGHVFGIAGPRHPDLSLSEIYQLTQPAL